MKHCKYCGRDLPEEMFYHHSTTKDHLHVKCKDCLVDYNKRHKSKKVTAEEKAARMAEWKSLVIGRKHPHDLGGLK